MLLWDKKPVAFPHSCVRPPTTSGVPVLEPLEDFLPDMSERANTLLRLHWWSLMDWWLVIRNNPVINTQPYLGHAMIKRFPLLLGTIYCYFPPSSIFSSISSCLFLLSSHRTLTAKSNEECSHHIQLLLSCSFKAHPHLSMVGRVSRENRCFLLAGHWNSNWQLLAGFVITWRMLDCLYISPQDCYLLMPL